MLALLVGSGFFATQATSHEYWLQVDQTELARGDTIEIRAFVGEGLSGNEQIYSDRSVQGFRGVFDGKALEIKTRQGDRPIGKIPRVKNGLYVAALMTNANVLTYQELKKFNTFATTHGNDFAVEAHQARGLPDQKFKESYFRFAKTLVKVGDGQGKDIATGMPYELIALTNPFTQEGSVRMMLTRSGKPVAEHHVDVFVQRPDSQEVEKSVYFTNALGEITIKTAPGYYLINAVHLDEPKPHLVDALDVVWNSLWASMTFRIE